MAKKQFKAESRRLLDLMINSIYTNREIFLREIISNASDALDKLCYHSLSDAGHGIDRGDLNIRISVDNDARTITVSDNGIGMTQEELDRNLGVIAGSGSNRFKSELGEDAGDIDIIGQFGVGFYSAFMVADRVTVVTRAFGSEEGFKWESSGADGYTIRPCERDTRGTDVIMHIKADSDEENYSEFLSTDRLQALVKKYSDYIRYPIIMRLSSIVRREETDENGETHTKYDTEESEQTVNSMVPIWQRSKGSVSAEDYDNYYREQYHTQEAPLRVISADVEGSVSYKALLYIPAADPHEFYSSPDQLPGVSLYSSGVMIMEKCEELLPSYFGFVRGVVDSQDLSLNISRELLQHDRQLKLIATNLEKKIRSELAKLMKEDADKYRRFYETYGTYLKYGAVSDFGQSLEKLRDLLMYPSSNEDGVPTSLKQYCERMPESQPYIYYACAETASRAAGLPQVERVLDAGYEVLYLTHEADEFIMKLLMRYDEHELRSVDDDELGLPDELPQEELDRIEEENRALLDFTLGCLGERVSAVRLSRKLKSHPVCMSSDGPVSLEMERYFSIMTDGKSDMKASRVLELNPEHSAFHALKRAYSEDRSRAEKYAEILYYQSLLIAGIALDEPARFTELVCELMQ